MEKDKLRSMHKAVEFDVEAVADALDAGRDDAWYYLDISTGQVLVLPNRIMCGEIFEPNYVSSLTEWEKSLLPTAGEILNETAPDRYIEIPELVPAERMELMLKYAQSFKDDAARIRLLAALEGRDPATAFEDALSAYPDAELEWYRRFDEFLFQAANEWLSDLGYEMDEAARESEEDD